MIDRERVEQLIALLKGSSAMELAVREDGTYVRVRRAPAVMSTVAGDAGREPAAQPATAGLSEAAGDFGAPDTDITVTARLVGRFFYGKGAGQPPLVNIGDSVEEGAPVATIEALGKITGVLAPEAGDVIEYLAEDGEAVGYGTPLMRLRREP